MNIVTPRNEIFSGKLRGLVAASALVFCAACWAPRAAQADKLRHSDGTVIEGRILNETPDDVRIQTSYGTLVYQKDDLLGIERDSDRATPTPRPTPSPTPKPSYSQLVPAGPINPFAPPQILPLLPLPAPSAVGAVGATTSSQIMASPSAAKVAAAGSPSH